jgi:hypothetical protein
VQFGAGWKGNSLKLKTSDYNDLFKKNETWTNDSIPFALCFRSKAYNLITSEDKTRNKNPKYVGQMGKQLILV